MASLANNYPSRISHFSEGFWIYVDHGLGFSAGKRKGCVILTCSTNLSRNFLTMMVTLHLWHDRE